MPAVHVPVRHKPLKAPAKIVDRMLEEAYRRIKSASPPPILTAEDAWLFRREREDCYKEGGPVAPVTYVPRFVIPPAGYTPPKDVVAALASISESFELISDPLTRHRWEGPEMGVHLYTVQKGNSPGGADLMILETPLSRNMEAQWEPGTSRAPGMWIVDWVKANGLDKYGSDPVRAAREINARRKERREARDKARRKRDLFVAQEMLDEIINPYVRLNRAMLKSPVSCKLK
jgi:hypothetical protein